VTVDAVLFDWGGTLSLYRQVDLLDMWRTAAAVLAPDDPEPVAAALLAAEDHWWQVQVRAGDRSGTTEDLLRSVAAETGLDVLSAAQRAYHDAWGDTVEHDRAARGTLAELKRRGLRTGLLSNTHWPQAVHDAWLDRDGLLELLDVRMYTSDMAHMKPHREAFLALCSALEVAPERCVFVGDRPHDDISGAASVGMRTVLLTGRPVPPEDVNPDAQLPDLRGLVDLIDRWRS